MRRKSERTASKNTKASPDKTEKKCEKPKRTRTRRKKHSTSSDNESADDASPVPEAPVVAEPEPKPPTTPVKGESPEESQDQVWQVKTAGAGDVGEIQKLKICLTRPPSTPERAERSPRSKRKHSRATSSSDTPSVEAPEERRKSRHRSKKSHRESKDDSEKNLDSQGEEHDVQEKNEDEVTQSVTDQKADSSATSENTITTSDEKKDEEKQQQDESNTSNEKEDNKEKVESSDNASENVERSTEKADKPSDADTTVVSPKAETTAVSALAEVESSANTESQDSQSSDMVSHSQSPARRRSMSVDKSEILELHPEESKCESDLETDKTKADDTMEDVNATGEEKQVSKIEDKSPNEKAKLDNDKSNVTGVVEKSKRTRNISTDSHNDVRKSTDIIDESTDKRKCSQSTDSNDPKKSHDPPPEENHKTLDRSDSIQSNNGETIPNGQVFTPIVVSRKRRWGARPAKITTQKSITISSDILKDIIPDVKPVEFEEVIEEKKHKRDRDVVEKVERPVLPKIVIDNSENVERNSNHRRLSGEKDRGREMKPKEPNMAANRKISIIKDNDSIITRPPSPPRHKQSSILFITNLVRPFTLPQLKNLLQRTGRLVDNGFWIDKIKSKCYVTYENEEQAIETRHALHGVTWPVSNPKTLQVDFSTQEAFDKAKSNEVADNAQVSTIPGTVEDWLREQDLKRERGELEKPWERKVATREWDLGKNDKEKEKDKVDKRREEPRPQEKRRHNRTPERSPEPARKFKKKEEEPPAKLLDDLFKKTKATPCIYWLPLSAETIAIKEEQRRQHMAEHERRMLEQRARAPRRH